MNPNEPANILLVDDTPANLTLLNGMLKERGYRTRPAPSGRLAIQAARLEPPDLILLDINMPDLDGYQVCEELKNDPLLRDIPVIFISALNETMDIVKAFRVGAVDFITKPFHIEEVDARVSAHLKLRRLQAESEARRDELARKNLELEELGKMRDWLTQLLVHDLRSPLTAILAVFEMFFTEEALLLPTRLRGFLGSAQLAADQLLFTINSILDVGKIEAGEFQAICTELDIVSLARESAYSLSSLCASRRIAITSGTDRVMICADRELLIRVFQNLISNAVKFTGSDGRIEIHIQEKADNVRVMVSDNGRGIPKEHHARIFEKFGQSRKDGPRSGTGLGLTFCKLAVELHGGAIGIESEPDVGSTFWFEVPIGEPPRKEGGAAEACGCQAMETSAPLAEAEAAPMESASVDAEDYGSKPANATAVTAESEVLQKSRLQS